MRYYQGEEGTDRKITRQPLSCWPYPSRECLALCHNECAVILGQRKTACNLYDVGEMNACLLEPFMICLATPALINARATIRHYALNTNGNQRRSLMILCQRDECSNYITSMGYSGTSSPIARLATFCHETIFGWCFPWLSMQSLVLFTTNALLQ
jgi:hypothetical protein